MENNEVNVNTETVEYIGFWTRALATLLDAVVFFLPLNIIFSMVFTQDISASLQFIIGIAYYIYMWMKYDGATIGKKIMKIKIVRVDGTPINLSTAVIRYIGYYISALVLCLGYLWVAFSKEKKAWHDMISGTKVVKS